MKSKAVQIGTGMIALSVLVIGLVIVLTSGPTSALASNPSTQTTQGQPAPGVPACGPDWVVVNSPNTGTSNNYLNGVAAVSATDVWAVGYYNGSAEQTLVEHWDGNTWSVVSSPNVGIGPNHLNGVAAVSATDVWAVGYYVGPTSPSSTLTEHWDGNTWSVVSSPNVGTGNNGLNGVAVVSATDVWAVGNYTGPTTPSSTLTEHWNGSTWSVVSSPNVGTGNNYLNGVAAVATNDVWTVGYYYTGGGLINTLIEHWNGSAWSIIASPNQTGPSYLDSVSEVNSNDVWAAGYWNTGGPYRTLVEHWDGSAWSVVPTPVIASGNYLYGVMAISASDVWAVGDRLDIIYQTLVEHWDGSAWSVVPSPNAVGTHNHLFGVVAVSASDVWAAGNYSDGSRHQTLVERYNPCINTATPTNAPTRTSTPTRTNTATNTPIPTNTPTKTNTATAPATLTPSSTLTRTNTPQATSTPTRTNSPTDTATNTPSRTPSGTSTPTNTTTFTPSPTNSATLTPTRTNTASPTHTPQPTQTAGGASATPVPSNTPTVPTSTPTNTSTPTQTATLVPTNTPTDTSTPQPTQTPGGPSATPTPTNTPTNTPVPTNTVSGEPTEQVTPSATRQATATPTEGAPSVTPTLCAISFTDVPNGSTFYSYIRCLACLGIINGYTDGTFRPNNNVTRGQLSKIVSNAAGFNEPQTMQMFEDVPVGSTFQAYIGRLASRGYISGYPCGGPGEPCNPPSNLPYFRTNNNATRGQIAKIDANAAGFNDPPTGQSFEDVPPGSTFYTYTQRLTSRAIMQGYPCGGGVEPCIPPNDRPYFRPFNNATRGQTSKIVANTFFPDCQTPNHSANP